MSSERTLSRPVRRASVIALYGAFVAGILLLHADGIIGPMAGLLAGLAMFIVSASAFGLLFTRTRYWRWGHAPDKGMDEYQILTRNRAYLNAYRGLATVVLLAMMIARIGGDLGWLTSITPLQQDIGFWGAFMLILTLPASILAWSDQPMDD